MCGLTGFYPKKNKKVDLTKLYPLWTFSEEEVHIVVALPMDQREQ